MPAIVVTLDNVLESLGRIGVQRGDLLYVASFMAMLGPSPTIVDETVDALLEAVGPDGTVVMPTFNFGFCHGELFDPDTTPSTTGMLTEVFRRRPGAIRTVDPPFHSVAAMGRDAQEIAELRSTSSFGKESVFHWLYLKNARQLMIGCGYRQAVSHFHWLEELYEVPYRYWKQFRGPVRVGDEVEERAYYMYARRLDIPSDWSERVDDLGVEFEAAGFVQEAPLGYGKIKAFCLQDFHRFFAPRIQADKLLLVEEGARPHYQPSYSPVVRLHHVGIVSRRSDKILKFVKDIGYHIAYEGMVPEFNVNTVLYGGFNALIEFVEPTAENSIVQGHLEHYPGLPIHHLAFEVDDLERAKDFFESRGYFPIDGQVRKGPGRGEYVYFLSPVNFAGATIELVFTDPGGGSNHARSVTTNVGSGMNIGDEYMGGV